MESLLIYYHAPLSEDCSAGASARGKFDRFGQLSLSPVLIQGAVRMRLILSATRSDLDGGTLEVIAEEIVPHICGLDFETYATRGIHLNGHKR